MNEARFRRNIMYALLKVPDCHFTHIEAHDSAPGIPDVNVFYKNRDFFIELKAIADDRRLPKLRPTQVRWARERADAGGTVFVWVIDGSVVHVFVAETMLPGVIRPADAMFHFQDGAYTQALDLMTTIMEEV